MTRGIKPNIRVLTDDDFMRFQDRCMTYQKLYGLTEWEITYEFTNIEEDHYADIVWNRKDMKAIIRLKKEMEIKKDYSYSVFDINDLAHHEILHLLLAEADDSIDRANIECARIVHTIINRIIQSS